MQHMWMVTGYHPDPEAMPFEFEATGAALALAKAITGEGDDASFRPDGLEWVIVIQRLHRW